ncbi:MAG: hypothetical protein AB1714_14680 [Acidobacteriota bacterium]
MSRRIQRGLYVPLPKIRSPFAYSAGSVHDTRVFHLDHPQFSFAPPVPGIGCTTTYAPPYQAVVGDVAMPPDIVRVSAGGREEYYSMARN